MNIDLLVSIINKAYWPIYGEMNILEEITKSDDNCVVGEKGCPELSGIYFSYIALMIYMIVANVLLVNLLIAMFRYIYI